MGLVGMSLWIYLMLFAIAVTSVFSALLKPKKKDIFCGIILGLILLSVDFAFEHFGVFANLWTISGSVLFIGVVPAEVMVIAFCSGFTYSLVFPKKFDILLAVLSSFLIGTVGIGIEAILISANLLNYILVDSYFALLAYSVVFFALNLVNSKLKLKLK